MNSKSPALIAIAFFVIWIAILYAGSDHPPPMAAITAGAALLAWTGNWTITTFWGPLTVVVVSGLFTATLLTLVVLPVLYQRFAGRPSDL